MIFEKDDLPQQLVILEIHSLKVSWSTAQNLSIPILLKIERISLAKNSSICDFFIKSFIWKRYFSWLGIRIIKFYNECLIGDIYPSSTIIIIIIFK